MARKKKSRDSIKKKSPSQFPIDSHGGINYLPPSGGKYLIKNTDDLTSKVEVDDLVEFIKFVVKDSI